MEQWRNNGKVTIRSTYGKCTIDDRAGFSSAQQALRIKATRKSKHDRAARRLPFTTKPWAAPIGACSDLLCTPCDINAKELQGTPAKSRPPGFKRRTNAKARRNPWLLLKSSSTASRPRS